MYEVDAHAITCTCPEFKSKGGCKHLVEVGGYKPKYWTSPSRPTFSQALSGLVKGIRVRDVGVAIKWLIYLDTIPQDGGRFRVARRLLIGSSEDGHSVSVMERVSDHFGHLCSPSAHLIELAAEVVRICKVPNWWEPVTNGPEYIRQGMIAYRQVTLYKRGGDSLNEQFKTLVEGIEEQDPAKALTGLYRITETQTLGKTKLAEEVMKLAQLRQHQVAQRLVAIHLRHKSALGGDTNFLTQAVWMMAGGSSPVVDTIEKVMSDEVKAHLKEQRAALGSSTRIEPWCCDGIHCGGSDRRFAGMWHDMMAVCNVYARTGGIDPDTKWLPEDYSLEGLDIVLQ